MIGADHGQEAGAGRRAVRGDVAPTRARAFTLVTKNSAVFTEEHGIDRLNRVAAGRGKELPPTYTVRSPSGGLHLYYGQNEHCLVRSHGHRPGWLMARLKSAPKLTSGIPRSHPSRPP